MRIPKTSVSSEASEIPSGAKSKNRNTEYKLSEPIRILQILPGGHICGGIENFIMNYYRSIDRTKVQFDFLFHYKEHGYYDEEIKSLGGKIYYFSAREDKRIFRYILQLKHFFAQHPEYKVIHGHMPGFAPIYFTVARFCGIPVRISHSHVDSTEPTKKGRILRQVMKLIPLTANTYWACSKEAGKFMYGQRKFTVINNAISMSRFCEKPEKRKEMREKLHIEDRFVVGTVGRCSPQKNQLFLLNVFEKIHAISPSSILLMIGEGELREKLENEIREKEIFENVIFLKNQSDIENYYQAMDVFVLPSLFEGMPVVLVEALSCGLPAIVSDRVVLKASKVRHLSLKESVETWADAILSVQRPENGSNRKELAKMGFDIQKEALKLEQRYQVLFETGKPE